MKQELKEKLPPIKVTKASSQAIGQNQIGITTGSDSRYILGTHGAGPCIILALHNPLTQTALLAHTDAGTILKSIEPYVKQCIGEHNVVKLQMHLLGGGKYSRDDRRKIIYHIAQTVETEQKAHPGKIIEVEIKTDVVNKTLSDSKNFAIDARDGNTSQDFDILSLGNTIKPSPSGETFEGIKCVLEPGQESSVDEVTIPPFVR